MKYVFTLLAAVCCILISCDRLKSISSNEDEPQAEKHYNILFIGNSLTYFNDMPEMVSRLALEAGKDIDVDSKTFPGRALRQIVNSASLKIKINERKWDYVILQSDDITAFPDMYHIEENTLQQLKEMIHESSPSAQIVYLMVWGLRNGIRIQELDGQMVYYSFETYAQKIYDGTLHLAQKLDLVIAPAGQAWCRVRDQYPDIELFSSDNAHPSKYGSYLCASVYYSVIFQDDCTNLNYRNSITAADARCLRSAASSAVLENLELWNIHKTK